MTWDAANARWKGTAAFALIGKDWQHPDVGADSARVFVAPRTGTVTVTGVVAKSQSGGDGITVRILRNNGQIWPAGTTAKTLTTTAGSTFRVTLAVTAGDRLEFVSNARTNAAYDTTAWDATVIYQ